MTIATKLPTKLLPLGNRLILRRIEQDSRGGIKMPDADRDEQQSQECEVVEPPSCEIKGHGTTQTIDSGDHIYIARHKGYSVTTNSGEELVIVDAEDVLCVEVETHVEVRQVESIEQPIEPVEVEPPTSNFGFDEEF